MSLSGRRKDGSRACIGRLRGSLNDLSAISKYCDRAILLNQGVKLGEGSPKDMIDAYKQVLVGQYETPKAGVDVPDLTADGDVRAALDKQKKKQEAARMGDYKIHHYIFFFWS